MTCNHCLNHVSSITSDKNIIKIILENNNNYIYICPKCNSKIHLKYDKYVNRVINLFNYKSN